MNHHTRLRLVYGAVLFLMLAFAADSPAQPVSPPPRPKLEFWPPLPDGAVARIGGPRLRLPGAVINVAFAPSGTTFVSTGMPGQGDDRLIVLWDAATGREIRQFKDQNAGVNAVAYSTDGKLLVTGSINGMVRLWDVATGNVIRQFPGHSRGVLAVAYSPDQKRIASVGHDNFVHVSDADTAKVLHQFPANQSNGTSNVRFSPDGKMLAAVGHDFAIRLWDPVTGVELKRLTGPVQDTFSLDFSPDGKRLVAIGAEGILRGWDVNTGRETLHFRAHKGHADCVRYSPKGSILATGGADGSILFWDADSGQPLRAAVGHPSGHVSEVSFSADGSILASAGHEGTVRLWDVATGLELPLSGGLFGRVALSPDGKRLATAGSGPVVRFWDTTSGKQLLPLLSVDEPVSELGFGADGRHLMTSNSVDEIRAWDPATGKRIRQMGTRTGAPIGRLAIGPDGRFVATFGGVVRLWDAMTGRPAPNSARLVAGLNRYRPVSAMAFSPGDNLVAVGSGDGRIRIWDVAVGQQTSTLLLGSVPLFPGAVAWAPDGRAIAAIASPIGSPDPNLRIWEVASGQVRQVPLALHVGQSGAWSVAFSPDGRIVAAGDSLGFLCLWDVRTGKELATSRGGSSEPITYLAFSPDGRFLVSAGADLAFPGSTVFGDGTAIVWDVAALVKELPPVSRPTASEIESLWTTLSGDDGVKAGNAIWQLAAIPELALPLLKQRLPKIAFKDSDPVVEKLLLDLDDDTFEVRERATAELIRLGSPAVRAVRQTFATTTSREVRRRVEEVLAKVIVGPASPEEILLARGVEVLQRIGTAESRELLKSWGNGPASVPLTQEARTALGRMGKSP